LVRVCLASTSRVCFARRCLVHEVLEFCLGFLFPGVRSSHYFDYQNAKAVAILLIHDIGGFLYFHSNLTPILRSRL
jgi:hypothetical protein